MNTDNFFSMLRCPKCFGALQIEVVPLPEFGRNIFGTLQCDCSKYPVIDGIPIIGPLQIAPFNHMGENNTFDGTTPDELVELVIKGKQTEALIRCLAPLIEARWITKMRAFPGRWKIAKLYGRLKTKKILANRDILCAQDILRFYFNSDSLGQELGDYFVHRVTQPRHLAALALAEQMPRNSSPVLDVACGVGHLDHYLTSRQVSVDVVGIDMCFFQLWIAKHWVAPRSNYLCCNVTNGLPFASGVFKSAIVSDAYHLFKNRNVFVAELNRVSPKGIKIFTRVGNKLVMPNEGDEGTLQQYLDEIGDDACVTFSEGELVRYYICNTNPFGDAPSSHGVLSKESKWFSIISDPSHEILAKPNTDFCRPHLVGSISINPIYKLISQSVPTRYRFEFPGIWYAYENHQMLEYHPRTVTLTEDVLEKISKNVTDDAVQGYIDSFVLVGLPERY